MPFFVYRFAVVRKLYKLRFLPLLILVGHRRIGERKDRESIR